MLQQKEEEDRRKWGQLDETADLPTKMLLLSSTLLLAKLWLVALGPTTKEKYPTEFSTDNTLVTFWLGLLLMYSPQSTFFHKTKPGHRKHVELTVRSPGKLATPIRQDWASLLYHCSDVGVEQSWPGRRYPTRSQPATMLLRSTRSVDSMASTAPSNSMLKVS